MRRQPASVEMATGLIDRGLVKLFVACAGVDREGSAGGAFLGVDDGVVASESVTGVPALLRRSH